MNFDRAILDLVYKFNGYGILLYVVITTTIAAVLACLLGLERQLRGKTITIKTHVLLAVGCSLLMTISIWAIRIADGSLDLASGVPSSVSDLSYDTSRIAAAVVAGIGFLGAGAIMKDKFSVHGLSTAAMLWICAAVGLACGSGFILGSIAFTVVTILASLLINLLNSKLQEKSPKIIVKAPNSFPIIKTINEFAFENSVMVRVVKILEVGESETTAKVIFAFNVKQERLEYFKNQLRNNENIKVE